MLTLVKCLESPAWCAPHPEPLPTHCEGCAPQAAASSKRLQRAAIRQGNRLRNPLSSWLAAAAGVAFLLVPALPATAQDPLPDPERKPQAPAAPALPPLPKVKGTIAKPPESADGRVAGLNAVAFDALQTIKRKNPGSLTLEDALALRAAIIRDDQIDAEEADLLLEMTQSTFRNITVTKAGAADKVTTFPTVAQAKAVLRETLYPQLNLEACWAAGAAGWRDIVLESSGNSEQQQRITAFVQSRIAEAWQAGDANNAYKPLRTLISQRYGFTKTSGLTPDQMEQARKLMIDACRKVDVKVQDQMPDSLYLWWKPAGSP